MKLIPEIWQSFRRLPLWVQLWMVVILVPANLATLLFLAEPMGRTIAGLAVFGMAFNIFPILKDRGFSKLMSLPHLILWTPLVVLLMWMLTISGLSLSSGFTAFLIVLLVIDLISLAFDLPDFWAWLKGQRAKA